MRVRRRKLGVQTGEVEDLGLGNGGKGVKRQRETVVCGFVDAESVAIYGICAVFFTW